MIIWLHKYCDLQELTPAILNDVVRRAEVHETEKIDSQRTQKIDIYYDLAGYLPLLLLTPNRKTA